MASVPTELRRLARARAASRARDLARRADLLVLAAAVALAFVSRAVTPLPGLAQLEGRWALAFAVAGGLLLLRPLLRTAARWAAVPEPRALAGRLDDAFGWKDDVGTAAGLAPAPGPVGALLLAQAAARLEQVDADRLWPSRTGGRRLRLGLAVLLLLVLLLPGVDALFRGRGAGGPTSGALGTRPEEAPTEPLDEEAWLREHARLVLRRPAGETAPAALESAFLTDAPLPAAWSGRAEVLLDDAPPASLGSSTFPAGERARRTGRVDLRSLETLRDRLTPGEHVVRLRLVPEAEPWRSPMLSNPVRILVTEDPSGGGGGGERPEPEAPRPPPPPPPAPVPDGPEERPSLPPPGPAREEVVTPLVRDGATVRKDSAVVAVRDPDAGTETPPPVPLEAALADFDRVVERAVPPERFRPRDREFLRRYFEALRAAAEGR